MAYISINTWKDIEENNGCITVKYLSRNDYKTMVQKAKKRDKQKRKTAQRIVTKCNKNHINVNVQGRDCVNTYREELSSYLNQNITLNGLVRNVKKLSPFSYRITIGNVILEDRELKMDHINIWVDRDWIHSNPSCEVGARFCFSGLAYEYKTRSNEKNIGIYARRGYLYEEDNQLTA